MDRKVSVVIPVYGVEDYLDECVESIYRQTYRKCQVILIDDGSTDPSGMICDACAMSDARTIVYHKANGGLSSARNTGIDGATGEYLYFLDSDDYIADDTIEKLVRKIGQENADMVLFDGNVFYDGCAEDGYPERYVRRNEYKTANGREMLQNLLNSDEYRTVVQLYFYNKKYIGRKRLRFLEGVIHEDEHFSFLAFMADGQVVHCHERLYYRRMRPGSIMTGSKAEKSYSSMLAIYDDLEKRYRGSFVCETSRQYMVRTAKGVLAKYQLLDEKAKETVADGYRTFCRNVLRHRGYEDSKLRIKCSKGIERLVYRAENKLMRMTGKCR